jgi:transposase-like protein
MDIAICDTDSNHWRVPGGKGGETVLEGIHRAAHGRESAARNPARSKRRLTAGVLGYIVRRDTILDVPRMILDTRLQGVSVMSSYLSAPHFHDEAAAFKFVEDRVWPKGPVCPRCGVMDRVGKLEGKSTRIGVYKCYECRKPFTVRIGTIFEDSHISMKLWLQAIFLIASSKKGISSNQLHRVLGVSLKSAWFLSHRISLAMDVQIGKLGSDGGILEADEAFIGRSPAARKGRYRGKRKQNTIFALVERDGKVKSTHVTGKNFSTSRRRSRITGH